jgi:hypothetical protein
MKFGKFEIYHQRLIFAITGITKNVFNFTPFILELLYVLCLRKMVERAQLLLDPLLDVLHRN